MPFNNPIKKGCKGETIIVKGDITVQGSNGTPITGINTLLFPNHSILDLGEGQAVIKPTRITPYGEVEVKKIEGNSDENNIQEGDRVINSNIADNIFLIYGDYVTGPILNYTSYDPNTLELRYDRSSGFLADTSGDICDADSSTVFTTSLFHDGKLPLPSEGDYIYLDIDFENTLDSTDFVVDGGSLGKLGFRTDSDGAVISFTCP